MKKLLLIFGICLAALPAFAQNETVKSAELKVNYGVPTNGINAVQTLTFGGTITGGTFTIGFAGQSPGPAYNIPTSGLRATAPITWSATNATLLANIDAALKSTNEIGPTGVTTAAGSLTAGIGTVTLTFVGKNARVIFPDPVVTSALTGTSPTLTAATTTPGVRATYRSAFPGALLIDATNGFLYVNQSTALYSPVWTQK